MLAHAVRNVLLNLGYFVSAASSDDEVRKVLRSLRPCATDKPLIRIGEATDGGYLVPDDLEGINYCFSPGVAQTAAFESELAARGIRSFLADYSVDAPPFESDMFHFEKKFLGSVNDSTFMTLEAWVGRSLPNYPGDLILQMDIEGSEYEVLMEAPEAILRKFRILIVEFHGLHAMFNDFGLKLIRFCLQKILRDFEVVHLHPNNVATPVRRGGLEIPSVIEMTFLRKDRIRWRKESAAFPHPLDRPNVPGKPDLVVPDSWYRSRV
jgi:hypothetical protein